MRKTPNIRKTTQPQQGRLRPQRLDPLEAVGLPSKGDTRLLNTDCQESYYNEILNHCCELSQPSRASTSLEDRVQSLELNDDNASTDESSFARATQKEIRILAELQSRDDFNSNDHSTIIQAMRKIREGIVATQRTDDFASRVYVFIIRFSILLRLREAYHPALLHVLHRLTSNQPLTDETRTEILQYHFLDLVCRQRDFNTAYKTMFKIGLAGSKFDLLLRTVVQGSWVRLNMLKKSFDMCQQRLIEYVSDYILKHAASCMGKTYLQIESSYFERSLGLPWKSFQAEQQVPWAEEGGLILIRQLKRK